MGGSGSTRWTLHWKKTTVEECLILGISSIRRAYGKAAFSEGSSYILSWSNGSQMSCYVRSVKGSLSLILSYKFRDQSKTPVIRLSTTNCQYGGVRYWMHCPYCGQRCAKLYMLGGWFGCRKCHDLTYTSAQEAHQFDGLRRMLGAGFDRLDESFEAQRLMEKWDARKRLTKGERKKIANALGVPLFIIRSRWYRREARKR